MSPELEAAISGSVDDWVSTLPAYQSELINSMLLHTDPKDVALTWLDASVADNTAPLGAIRVGVDAFFDNVLAELHKLFCTEDGYSSERTELIRQARAGRSALTVFVCSCVGSELHIAPVILAPAIALILAILATAGAGSVCAALDSLIASRQPADIQENTEDATSTNSSNADTN